MAVTINASTSSGLGITSDNSGAIQFQSNGANTVGITTGGLLTVSGNQAINGPAFSAYRTTAQTGVASSTFTKVQLTSEYFDTANCFDSSTNYRFTPTVAGYYQVNATLYVTGTGLSSTGAFIYKNGSLFSYGTYASITVNSFVHVCSNVIYLNGTTDYIELYGIGGVTSGTVTFGLDTTLCQFSASMVRGA